MELFEETVSFEVSTRFLGGITICFDRGHSSSFVLLGEQSWNGHLEEMCSDNKTTFSYEVTATNLIFFGPL